LGFSHVIDLNADPSEKALSRKAGMRYYPIKTEDELSVDSWITNTREAVSIITRAERRKEKVYLHCTFGVGRSPTIAMAYLVSKNWSAQAAIERVKAGATRVWSKGNPVTKYEGVLRAYADLIAGRTAGG
jgi:protein-tyrosine phosphatase